MTFGGLKKWEIISLAAVGITAVTLRILQETGAVKLSFQPVIIVLMILAAGLMLWRVAAFLIKFARLKKNGLRYSARVVEYSTEKTAKGGRVFEIIQYKDENGKKRRKSVETFMPSQKIGREYTLYQHPENDSEFYLAPQCFISMWIDIGFAITAEILLVVVMLLNNGE